MKINTEDDGVFEVKITSSQVRAYFDGEELPEAVMVMLDEAQGHIYGETGKKAYLVIEISDD